MYSYPLRLRRTRYLSLGACKGCGRKRTAGWYLRTHSGSPDTKHGRHRLEGCDVYISDMGNIVLDCAGCGRPQLCKPVRGTFKPDVKCNARCTGSTGFVCDCSCGGKNHGAAYG